MLTTMQHMQYFVKTGFRIAKTPSFGGSAGDLLMSLGQGSGTAPMGMRNIITLADNAYKRLGHGINMESSISAPIFLLAAIIYVDDTDLLHWAKFYGISDKKFVQCIQTATTDWGMLVQATGGALKPSKSFWYLLTWKFVRGIPTIKPVSAYNHLQLLIPQPDGSQAKIALLDNNHTAKTLGVWSNPLNSAGVPLIKLKNKGMDWVDRLNQRPLERRDVWLSLTTQEYPRRLYGLSSLYATLHELDTVMGAIYYKALPHLGFNRHITTEFRTLPSSFQGIGLRQWSIEKLAKDISVLLRHWQSTTTLGQGFQLLYEAFQMEVGLDGNIFTQSFTDFGHLATHSWFKILWQYASQYQVQVLFTHNTNCSRLDPTTNP
jgi:hypothetical protein